jgi:predicted metal-dependent TIM-barrel fold hydrolase
VEAAAAEYLLAPRAQVVQLSRHFMAGLTADQVAPEMLTVAIHSALALLQVEAVVGVPEAGHHHITDILGEMVARQLTLMVNQLPGYRMIQPEFMGVFHK